MNTTKKPVSKFTLFAALANGSAMPEIGFTIVNAIEREDGSNQSYNVTGYNSAGDKVTKHVRAA